MLTDDLKRIASKSQMRFRLAALVVDDEKIIHMGYNRPFVSRKMAAKGYFSTHAEIDVLKKINHSDFHPLSDKLAIVVVRMRRDGSFGNAKPCHRCMVAIWKSGIRKVHHTDDNGQVCTIVLSRKP